MIVPLVVLSLTVGEGAPRARGRLSERVIEIHTTFLGGLTLTKGGDELDYGNLLYSDLEAVVGGDEEAEALARRAMVLRGAGWGAVGAGALVYAVGLSRAQSRGAYDDLSAGLIVGGLGVGVLGGAILMQLAQSDFFDAVATHNRAVLDRAQGPQVGLLPLPGGLIGTVALRL